MFPRDSQTGVNVRAETGSPPDSSGTRATQQPLTLCSQKGQQKNPKTTPHPRTTQTLEWTHPETHREHTQTHPDTHSPKAATKGAVCWRASGCEQARARGQALGMCCVTLRLTDKHGASCEPISLHSGSSHLDTIHPSSVAIDMTTVTMTTISFMPRTRSSSSPQRWGSREGEIMEEQRG